ncbi:MAG: FHA domain-containing protein [Anaerolineae bacterium]|jgi:pSer/pThr/pTyr-binding forkhead associated (FHA) protein|nr:FHA domain-containing protein [Anaerolineae bacterium]
MNYMENPQTGQRFTLTGTGGETIGQVYQGTGTIIVIGRQPECQIQINNNKISRQHTRLSNISGQWVVEDLNSANGTYVNGQRISGQMPIRNGDRLKLGALEFSFSSGGDLPATVIDVPQYQAPPQPFPPAPQPQYQQQPPPQQAYYPPPQPQPQQPVYVAMPAAEPKKKGRPCLVIFLIMLALLCIGSIIIGLIFGVQIYNEVMNLLGQANITGIGNTTTGSATDLTGLSSLLVSSNEGGVVTTSEGASLIIPPGAVPRQENGDPGQMTFSMVPSTNRTPTFDNDFQAIGEVYELGPEGFTFSTPVTLLLPIPDGVDPSTVMGATTYDEISGTWVTIPASVDAENRLAAIDTTHFSPWSLFGTRPQGPSYDTGILRVVNDHRYNTGSYPPPGGNKPYGVTYGICIDSYVLDDPVGASSWSGPSDWLITVSDYRSQFSLDTWDPRSRDYRFPTGTYTLTEVWHFSEVNYNPLDLPEYSNWYRPYGTVYIGKGDVVRFTYTSSDVDISTMTEGRPVCFGVEDTAVGTGDVQVTLTWDTSVDLDLWIEDPNGDIVYYNYTPIPSGGQLDRDNKCDDFVLGRPENIYWPSGSAPSGTYTVQVDYYGGCESSGTVSYTVRTVIQGQVNTYEGTISYGDPPDTVTTFTVP